MGVRETVPMASITNTPSGATSTRPVCEYGLPVAIWMAADCAEPEVCKTTSPFCQVGCRAAAGGGGGAAVWAGGAARRAQQSRASRMVELVIATGVPGGGVRRPAWSLGRIRRRYPRMSDRTQALALAKRLHAFGYSMEIMRK